VAAVDLPSGLLADLPEVPGPAVSARLTVAFTAPKLAHLLPPAADHVGDLRVVAIGSPPELLDNPEYRVELVDPAMVARALPPRPRDGHKGTFGHVHVVAGSRGKSGAALMTGMAALRSGAGLVTLWLPRGLQRDVIGKFPELMTEFLPDTARGTSDRAGADAVLEAAAEGDVLVVGPGLTTEPGTRALVEELVRRSKVPVVLDADGLNAFAGRFAELRNDAGAALVLTPHPGEMARLAGTRIGEVQRARIETARGAAEARGVTIVLKGYRTVTATPSRRVLLNPTGNPGMATAGSGDILAGIAGRFVAGWQRRYRGANAEALAEHVAAAVYLHGLAGDLAAAAVGTESLVATDLLPHLPAAFRSVAGPGPGPA
jgi:NAD(P)H-hydrate epimerase